MKQKKRKHMRMLRWERCSPTFDRLSAMVENLNASYIFYNYFTMIWWNDAFGSYRFPWLQRHLWRKTLPCSAIADVVRDCFEADITQNCWSTTHLNQLKIAVDNLPKTSVEMYLILLCVLPPINLFLHENNQHHFPPRLVLRTHRLSWVEFGAHLLMRFIPIQPMRNCNEDTTYAFWKIIRSLLRKRLDLGNHYHVEDEFLRGINNLILFVQAGCAIDERTETINLCIYCCVEIMNSLMFELESDVLHRHKRVWSLDMEGDARRVILELSVEYPEFCGMSLLTFLSS